MANARVANKILADSTGAVVVGPVKVAYILFTPSAANDELVLRETSDGADCFYLRSSNAKQTQYYDFSRAPLFFNNGIYIQTITSGAKVVLVTTTGTTAGG